MSEKECDNNPLAKTVPEKHFGRDMSTMNYEEDYSIDDS